ncbi:MAG: hypothetical protein E7172_02585 [Firmicutes bacterium]|nr:hypothetical protein [Bacillota bacterium]
MNNLKKFYEEKKSIVLSIIAVITLLTLIIGATYAYFQASIGNSGKVDVGVETGDVDTLTFIAEDKIEFNISLSNFSQGAGNVGDTATAKAQLIASRALQNETRFAEEDYNVFLVITENDFEYTTNSGEMELRLQVTDPNGNKVTAIEGLNYITTDTEGNALEESEQGFDITTRTGSFLIAADWDIRTNDILVQDWLIDVTMINLDSNQNKNAGKTFNGQILMQKEGKATYEVLEINNLVDTTTTYNSITTTLDVKDGTEVANKYYFGIEEVTEPTAMIGTNILRLSNKLIAGIEEVNFNESNSATYTFSNLKSNTRYKIYAYAEDINKIKSNVYETEITTVEYEIPVIESVEESSTLNTITVNVNAKAGDGEIVTYLYSINDEEYIESESSSHTFENLQDTSEYKIKIKVKDENGYESTEWVKNINTEVYVLPSITKVESSSTYNSITLTTTAVKGREEISKYWYSIDGGEFVEGTSSKTFNGLEESKEYNFKVKVSDINERYSEEYSLSASTIAYVLPKVTNVSVTSTSSTLTVKVTASNGDGNVVKYYYSKNNGSEWESNTTGTYVFDGLTSEATYNIKVYVEDNNGRISSEYVTSGTTSKIVVTPTIANSTSGSNGWYTAMNISASVNATTDSPTIKHCTTASNTCDANLSYNGAVTLSENASARRICFQAIDIGGNTSDTVCSDAYKVDGEVPTVTSPSGSSDGIITFTASDNHSGVDTYCINQKATDTTGCTWYTAINGSNTSEVIITTSGEYYVHLKDKAGNIGNSFSFTVTITPTLAEYVKDLYTTDEINGLYYHDGDGTYINANLEAGDNSYRFSGEDYIVADNHSYSHWVDSSTSTDVGVIKFYCSGGDSYSYVGSSCSSTSYTSYYYLDYDSEKTEYSNIYDAAEQAVKDGYLKSNVNNYVCFGSDNEKCPDENLYRIIGVFNNNGEEQVKLIKWDYATSDMLGTTTQLSTKNPYVGTYKGVLTEIQNHYGYGSSNHNSIWSESTLNTITLNTNYLNYLDKNNTKWRNMIAITEWQQAGMTLSDGYCSNAKNAYDYELGVNKVIGTFVNDCDGFGSGTTTCTYNATTNAKVGLMYVSEYYYAASPTYWSYSGYNECSNSYGNYSATEYDNWIYMGDYDWPITRIEDSYFVGNTFRIECGGKVGRAAGSFAAAIRPTFNLVSTVKYSSGTGTKIDPYRITL